MKRLLKVTAMTGLLTLFRMSAGFAVAKVVAIYTGPSGLALLGQLQNLINTFIAVVNAPVGNGVVRYTAENCHDGYNSCAPWWRASIQWGIGLSLVLMVLGCFWAKDIAIWALGDPKYYWLILLTSVFLPFAALGTLINSIVNGQQLYKRYVSMGFISTLVASALMIGLIVFGGLYGALIAASIQMGLIGVVLCIVSIQLPWFKLKYFFGETTRKCQREIGIYIVMAGTTAVTMPLALLFIRKILVANVGWDGAGQWQAVWKISEVYLGVITMALGTYYLPRLSSLDSYKSIKHEVFQTIKVVMPLVVMMAFVIYLLKDIIILLLFTSEFAQARELFSIQLLGDVLKILSWLFAYVMLAKGTIKWFVSTEVICTLTFVALSYFLIPIYQLNGVTIAYAINYFMYLCLISLNLKKIVR